MYYLKMPKRLNLVEDEITKPVDDRLTLVFYKEDNNFETIKDLFSDVTNITIYGCIEQEDGRETDEFICEQYNQYTSLSKISYDLDNNAYSVTLVVPNETEERLSELEDALNFLLMGGEE